MVDQSSGESRTPDRQRWRQVLVAAGRWTLDVLRGHAWSRHLDQPEE